MLGATLAALVLLGASASSAAAYEPVDSVEQVRREARQRSAVESPQPAVAPTRQAPARPAPQPTEAPNAPGYDISYPQCGDAYPEPFAFGIVGVNGGRVFSANPCLGPGEHPSQLAWAGPNAQLYANTGNPGPELSSFWPHGQTSPRQCDTAENPGADTIDCAYDYGWNAAEHSYRTAVDAFIALGWAEAGATHTPTPLTWWLDVETSNSWRSDPALNVAALEGARDYLESVEVASVGFYSTPQQWFAITGGTRVFVDHPAWHAGASRLNEARQNCADEALTGGDLVMAQYFHRGFDANHLCG